MPVLKQNHNTPAMREAIVLDLGDIGAQAARIRAAAETQAAKIISEAQSRSESIAEQLHDEAQKKGYADGVDKGLAEGREQGRAEALTESAEQLRQLSAAWSQVATDWEQQRTDMEREARQAVLDFALSAAEKIVHRVIEVDESVVVDQVAQALSLVLSSQDASVQIHPVDRPLLEDALPELLSELANLEHIDLVDDEGITPGGCVVTFGQGRVDATIERQLQRLIDLILPGPVREDAQAPVSAPVEVAPDEIDLLPEVDLQSVADAAAQEVLEPVIEPVAKPPIYEITDQGLVQKEGESVVESHETLGIDADQAKQIPPNNESESEA